MSQNVILHLLRTLEYRINGGMGTIGGLENVLKNNNWRVGTNGEAGKYNMWILRRAT